MKFGGLARWPLLLGAIICFVLALWEESHETAGRVTVAIVALTVGSVMLGAWIYSIARGDGGPKGDDDDT